MSYYGYQQRVKADQKAVDYGQIQTGLNKAFEEIQTQQADKREARETDIAELRTDVNKELEQAREAARTNKGDDTFNAQVLSMANQSAQHMRALENLLRAGKINPSDYAIQRQNLIDSVTQLRVVTAAYKDSINQAVTRQEEGIASTIEANEMNEVQGVLDLENHQLMVDPTSGMIRMANLNDGTSLGVGEVQVRMMNKYDKYDFTGKVGEYAKLLDTVIEDNGYVRTENPFSLAGGRNLEASIRENFVNGISENDKASILLDSSTGYSIIQGVRSEADYEKWKKTASADEIAKGIWLKPDSKLGGRVNAVLQPEQKDAVVEKAIQEVKAQTKYSKTITPKRESSADISKKETKQTRIANINRLRELYRGDASTKSSVLGTYSKELDALIPKNHMLLEAKVSKNGLSISYYDPDFPNEILERIIPVDTSSEENFIKSLGPALTGDNNLLTILSEAGESGTDAFVDEIGTLSVKRTVEAAAQELKPIAEAKEEVKMEFSGVFYDTDAEKTKAVLDYLNGMIKETGIEGAKATVIEVDVKDDDGNVTGQESRIEISHPDFGTYVVNPIQSQDKAQVDADSKFAELHQKASQGGSGNTKGELD